MRRLEVKRVFDSTDLILPKKSSGKLNRGQADWFYGTGSADGSVRLSPYDPAVEKAMKIAEKAAKAYRNALAQVAEWLPVVRSSG